MAVRNRQTSASVDGLSPTRSRGQVVSARQHSTSSPGTRRQCGGRQRDFRYAAALRMSLTQSGSRRRLVSTRRIRWASEPEEARMQFTNTTTIARRPAEVFAYLAHFENVPRWNYAISDTRKTSSGPVGVGSHYRQTRTLPTQSEETFEV